MQSLTAGSMWAHVGYWATRQKVVAIGAKLTSTKINEYAP
jgi:hypothetical protein